MELPSISSHQSYYNSGTSTPILYSRKQALSKSALMFWVSFENAGSVKFQAWPANWIQVPSIQRRVAELAVILKIPCLTFKINENI